MGHRSFHPGPLPRARSPVCAIDTDCLRKPFFRPHQGDFTIKNFHFNDGEVLPELRLHYVTLGKPHRNSSGQIDNSVLLLHSTGGDTTEFFDTDFSGPLYGAGEPLDLAKFY